MKEIRLHGRGGQGAVTMGHWIVHCLAIEGKYGAAIPQYGFERRLAPVASFVRMDDEPIREKTRIYTPDCLIVIDSTVANAVDIYAGLKEQAILVMNQKGSLKDFSYPPSIAKVGVVDATAIGLEVLGRPITNSCMLGAFAATTGWIKLESIYKSIADDFSGALLEKNRQAARLGFERCSVATLGDRNG
ncbi:MAG: 2-oxoacid:acceptor oxidoreductase family protein [Chloroflexi bacterium]|nr:2-oxoacid:acceptor oxidoreductase family protein [Chloroflexota bacterium]